MARDADLTVDSEELSDVDDGRRKQTRLPDPTQRYGKPVRKRLVHSLSTALDETNYMSQDKPKKNKIISTFTNEDNRSGKKKQSNIIKVPTGATRHSKDVKTPRQAWDFFITTEMREKIKRRTNDRINKFVDSWKASKRKPRPEHKLINDMEELDAFIGLQIYRGVFGMAMTDVDLLFSKEHGRVAFSGTMSRDRFVFLHRCLNFDDATEPSERAERVKKDKGAAIREIFEAVNEQWAKGLVPSDYMTIHETLYPCRNLAPFTVYNKAIRVNRTITGFSSRVSTACPTSRTPTGVTSTALSL